MAPADSEARRALLPAGLRDGLPPDAAQRAAAIERLIAEFSAHGYERVEPPMVEFEDSLLAPRRAGRAVERARNLPPDGSAVAAHDGACAPT
ncbi:MAG: ATP phosphoribosyltransferase regulatory subunit [Pseudomonadota bacterium]